MTKHRLVYALASTAILLSGCWFFMRPKPHRPAAPAPLHHGSLVLINQTPYTVVAAVHVQLSPQEQRTEDWYTLLPTETKVLDYDFAGEPTFQLYGESRSPTAIRWLHKRTNRQGTLYFQGREDSGSDHRINYTGADLSQTSQDAQSDQPGVQNVDFMNVPVALDGRAFYPFRDPLLPNLTDMSGLSVGENEEQRIIAARVLELTQSLSRQLQAHAMFPTRQDEPYLLDADLKDSNGRGALGVVVDKAFAKTIFDDPALFQPGDRITGLSDGDGVIPVFAHEDIVWFLNQHATNLAKGIAVPIKVRLIRGASELEGLTTYRFNLAAKCWPPGDLDDVKSFFVGALNTWTFGNEAWAESTVTRLYQRATSAPLTDAALLRFQIIQRNARLRQHSPRAMSWGENLAMLGFIPTAPRFIAERLLARTIFMSGATAVLTSAALDTAEGAVWVIQLGSPLRSRREILGEVKRATPMNAGISLVVGTWSHHAHLRSIEGSRH